MPYKVVILGAGVVGLSSALCCQDLGFEVIIVSDSFGTCTTSHVAGGLFLPYNRDVLGPDRRQLAIDVVKRSWNHYLNLHTTVTKHTGVMKSFGYQCYFTDEYGDKLPSDPLAWEVIDKLRPLTIKELKSFSPHSPCSGWVVQTYMVQGQYYLRYMMGQFLNKGGRVIQQKLNSFDELQVECDVVINCTGLGARDLCNDTLVHPASGQICHMRAPHIKHFFHVEEVLPRPPEKRQLLYILPQTDHVVVGGTYSENNEETVVKNEVKERFLNKLATVAPSLKECEILEEKVGVRPTRSAIRLEHERVTLKDGRKLQVVHNYGHGGNGVALSWGTSEIAAKLAASIMSKSASKI